MIVECFTGSQLNTYSVTGILLLETLMTIFTFYAFWTSLTFKILYTIDPLIIPSPGDNWSFVALAPITGIGG